MRARMIFRRCVVSLSLLGMLTCQLAQAVAPTVRDVALPSTQVLSGQLIDAQGVPQADVEVALIQEGAVVAATRTDDQGRFALSGVQAGVYHLQTPTTTAVYRVWAPRTAPPAAQDSILLVAGDTVIRQQGSHILGALANPWVLAGIVAAAIAIPLALDDDDAS